MTVPNQVTNIVIAGLGGQGIVTGSDILSGALFKAGYDVKKSEIHGMSQRGGSVCSDIRFGRRVNSPMVPAASADFLVITESTQIEPNRHRLHPKGRMITPDDVPFLFQDDDPKSAAYAARMINVALLGVLSAHLPIEEEVWLEAIRAALSPHLHDMNCRVFLHARRVEQIINGLNSAEGVA
ncbi:2-oxoacid:acceptor oxidoreductase family protein [Halorhodospira halochloris]|uniref:2-oxoacid:acceptor oxidoreductase family protein n=1 Tax=Halorhodospira halochloris TaxID=1052 RepID=UPI001EE7A76B|nr:2-oxoacid:acceptor oxidoreductase family protein [Halorhodospira halochloris]MCG5531202.1 2-oxoacid:acceptor oxidoreductase family protein [Halorhodospira halochloris]